MPHPHIERTEEGSHEVQLLKATLTRLRIMNIELGKLKPNTSKEIAGKELGTFLKSLGL